MSLQLDSTTVKLATAVYWYLTSLTTCLLFLERSSQNWQQTQCRVASLSHFACCTAFPHLPTTSVLSHPSRLWGPQPNLFFASTEAPAASSASTTSRWPFEAAIARGPSPQPEGSTQSYRRSCSDWNTYQQHVSKHLKTKISLNWIGKSKLRTYNNLFNLQAYPFSGVRLLRRLAPGSRGPPAASVGQLRRCLLLQPARCLCLKAETLDVWQSKVYS